MAMNLFLWVTSEMIGLIIVKVLTKQNEWSMYFPNQTWMNTGNNDKTQESQVVMQKHFEWTLKNVLLSNIIRITGEITVPKKNITTLVLEDPDRLCGEDAKEDTEAMFIDPIYNVGYIIQKVRPRNEIKTPVIFKVIKFTIDISILK